MTADRDRDKSLPPMTSSEVRTRVMGWLARREHSAQQVRRKLARLACPANLAETVIAQLQAENLLSDERFAETFHRSRSSRGYGPARIKAELRQHGVPDETIQRHATPVESLLLTQARAVLAKRFGPSAAGSMQEKARRARFLTYRGFPSAIVAKALVFDEMLDEQGDAEDGLP